MLFWLFATVLPQSRAQDCDILFAPGFLFTGIPESQHYTVQIPPIAARVDRAELEITATKISTTRPVTYEIHIITNFPTGGFAIEEKIGAISIGTNVGSRTLTIPLETNFIAYLQRLVGTNTNQYFNVNLAGVFPDAADAHVELLPAFARVKLWITPTNAPVVVTSQNQVPASPGLSLNLNAWTLSCARLQWQKDGVNIPGATDPYFFIPQVGDADQGEYTVVAANSFGATTSSVTRLQFEPRAAAIFPGSQSIEVFEGEPVRNCFTVLGWPAPQIRWEHDGQWLPWATNACLELGPARLEDAGEYRLIVTNSLGAMTNSFVLQVRREAPFIFDPPDLNAVEGGTVTFGAGVTGGPVPALFLFLNGTNISLPQFQLRAARTNHSGTYYFVASNILGVATSRVASITVRPAGPLDKWTQKNPLPQGETIRSLAAGNGLILGVADNGNVVASTNGRTWELRSRPAEAVLNAVAFLGNRFVAAGNAGMSLASADGRDWDYGAMIPPGRSFGSPVFYGLASGEGRVIALASGGIFTSTNALEWESVLDLPLQLAAAAHGNGLFVAVGESILISVDGLTWTHLHPTQRLEDVAFLDGRFVAVGDDGTILTSSDGIEWQARSSGTLRRLYEVAFGNGRYVAVGARGTIVSSADAVTWRSENSGTPDRLEALLFHEGQFIAAGENGTTITSPDGVNWTKQNIGTTRDLDGMVVAADRIVAVGKAGSILVSTNGVDYHAQNAGVTNDIHGVAWNTNLFVAVGENGVILSSPDAIDWTTRDSGVTNSFKRLIYAKDLWITVGTEGTIVISADGTNWTVLPRVTLEDLNDIAYGNGAFVIVGDTFLQPNGTVLRSENGILWQLSKVEISKNLRAVAFADGMFVAAANDGLIAVSTNGISWEIRPTATPPHFFFQNLRDVHWANGLWSIVGNNGTILTSPDARAWTPRFTTATENMHELGVFRGRSISVGNRGTIIQSERWLAPWLMAARANGRFTLRVTVAEAGELQGSSDLRNWTTVTNWTGWTLEYSEPSGA